LNVVSGNRQFAIDNTGKCADQSILPYVSEDTVNKTGEHPVRIVCQLVTGVVTLVAITCSPPTTWYRISWQLLCPTSNTTTVE